MPQHLLAYGLTIALGYLLGSIPFGVLITRGAGVGDVRAIGSGNIGATNVLRTGRKDLALLTLLGDGGKGAIAVLGGRWLAARMTNGSDLGFVDAIAALAGGGAFVGHLFSVWLRFKGGKGVATFFGVLLAAFWPAGIMAALTWLGVAALLRISSLAALTAAALAPLFIVAGEGSDVFLILAAFMAVLIWIRHRANISRLVSGREPRIGGSKGAGGTAPEPLP